MDGKWLALFLLTAFCKHTSHTSLGPGIRRREWDRYVKAEAKRACPAGRQECTGEAGACGLGHKRWGEGVAPFAGVGALV